MQEVLFTHERCHVFRLPPSNFLASEHWEGNHIWTGAVKVIRDGLGMCSIVLEEPNGEVFGTCPLKDNDDAAFQQASDSSRCFVIRVEHGALHAYLGLNFEQKPDAFRFSTTVVERNKHARPAERLQESGRSLKQEDRIQIDLSGKLKSSAGSGAPTGAPGLVLQQPPKAGTGASRRIGAHQLEGTPEGVRPPSCTAPSPPSALPPPCAPRVEVLDSLFGSVPVPTSAPKKSTLDDLFS